MIHSQAINGKQSSESELEGLSLPIHPETDLEIRDTVHTTCQNNEHLKKSDCFWYYESKV